MNADRIQSLGFIYRIFPGGARLRMILSALEENERSVLSWGTRAAVIRPQALVSKFGATRQNLAARCRS